MEMDCSCCLNAYLWALNPSPSKTRTFLPNKRHSHPQTKPWIVSQVERNLCPCSRGLRLRSWRWLISDNHLNLVFLLPTICSPDLLLPPSPTSHPSSKLALQPTPTKQSRPKPRTSNPNLISGYKKSRKLFNRNP